MVRRRVVDDPSDLMRVIAEVASSLTHNPKAIKQTLPDVAVEVMSLCERPNVDAVTVENAIARDPFVSAQILSLANSPMFAPRMPIESVRDAIVRIGLITVNDLVLMVVASSSMFRIVGFEDYVRRTTERFPATAVAARILAQRLGLPLEAAFTAGLLHDVGALVLLDNCVRIGAVTPAMAKSPTLLQAVRTAIQVHHGKVGAAICANWKMPTTTIEAAAHHHDGVDDNGHVYANLVRAADVFADVLGVGTTEKQRLDPTDKVFKDFKLSENDVLAAMAEFIELLPTFSKFK